MNPSAPDQKRQKPFLETVSKKFGNFMMAGRVLLAHLCSKQPVHSNLIIIYAHFSYDSRFCKDPTEVDTFIDKDE